MGAAGITSLFLEDAKWGLLGSFLGCKMGAVGIIALFFGMQTPVCVFWQPRGADRFLPDLCTADMAPPAHTFVTFCGTES